MTIATQAEALFVSSLQPSDRPSPDQVFAAIRVSQQTHGGVCGCALAFATEYGEHPESSASRMRWALSQVGASTAAEAVFAEASFNASFFAASSFGTSSFIASSVSESSFATASSAAASFAAVA